jgi:hypothetical protein
LVDRRKSSPNIIHSIPDNLVGLANESSMMINGVQCKSLIDTGATVSTMSEHFCRSLDVPIISLDGMLLDVEGATGHLLPYLGYIDVSIEIPSLHMTNDHCLLLVVPDTSYNNEVPVIIGTNILYPLKSNVSSKVIATPDNISWNRAFQCLAWQDRQLSRNEGMLALIKSVSNKTISIPCNRTMIIPGIVDSKVSANNCLAVMQHTARSMLPDGVEVVPLLVDYHANSNDILHVVLSNHTSSTITIPSKAIISQLQWCTNSMLPSTNSPGQPSNDPTTKANFLSMFDIAGAAVNDEQRKQLEYFINSQRSVFSLSEDSLGFTNLVQHKITLNDCTPFKQKHRRIPPAMYDELRQHLQTLLDTKVIKKSNSPWSSNIVIARKKNGDLRLCIDYRQLNLRTIKDSYALPRIEEVLDCLSGSKYFTVLDMKSGYHNIEVLEEHKSRTAFSVGALGLYEYERMPFGLTNAPATYQRLMEELFGDINHKECVIFLDDIVVYAPTFEEHLTRLKNVFGKIRESGMLLSPKKCHFCQRKTKYLGHVISADGIETDPDKTDKVKNWPRPTNVDDVRKFTSFAGYYRRFVKNFSQIAKPLNDLLVGITNKKGKSRKCSKIKWKWDDDQENAFCKLKEILISSPILAYANYSLPFEVHIDASGFGLDAVLYQEQDGHKRVISYASRGLKPAEKNYPVHKREFLALKWSVTEKFHEYLYGSNFVVYTDNNPLTYVTSTAKLDCAGHRWLATLSAYDFTIKYKPGKTNTDADILSRLPSSLDSYEVIAPSSIHALCNIHVTPYINTLCMSTNDLTTGFNDDDNDVVANNRLWRLRQREDPTISLFLTHVTNKEKPKYGNLDAEGKLLVKQFNRLVVKRGVLYRRVELNEIELLQLVLPVKFRSIAFSGAHSDVGHPGRDRTLSILKDRFYWPKMYSDIETWISKCDRCIKRKSPTNARAPMVSIITHEPLEMVCMDYLTIEMSKGGYQYILVVTDHYTKFALAIPTRNMTAKTTATAFFTEFVVHYGLPKRIHSDQGANFEGEIFKHLCQLTGMIKSRTSPYRPSGNGLCERFNRTLLGMLGTLDPDHKIDWKSHLGSLVHAYNCTRHESTGYSPYYLMFGRKPRLALDVTLGLVNNTEPRVYGEYIANLKTTLDQVYKLASNSMDQARSQQKMNYDKKCRGATLEVNDRVLVKILAFDGKHKIADKWESQPYVVLEKPNQDIPVFNVQVEDGNGPIRTLHRNHLLPIGELPLQASESDNAEDLLQSDSGDEQESIDSEEHDILIIDSSQSTIPHISTALNFVPDQAGIEQVVDFPDPEPIAEPEHVLDQPDPESLPDPDNSFTELEADVLEQTANSGVPEIEHVVPVPIPKPRRSLRNRKPPEWITSGDFVLKSHTATVHTAPEWEKKADYIMSLVSQGILSSNEVKHAMLSILS